MILALADESGLEDEVTRYAGHPVRVHRERCIVRSDSEREFTLSRDHYRITLALRSASRLRALLIVVWSLDQTKVKFESYISEKLKIMYHLYNKNYNKIA